MDRRERERIPVGHHPRALALSKNGHRLACANMASGDVSIIDTNLLTEERRLHSRGFNLRGLSLVRSADKDRYLSALFAPGPDGDVADVGGGRGGSGGGEG